MSIPGTRPQSSPTPPILWVFLLVGLGLMFVAFLVQVLADDLFDRTGTAGVQLVWGLQSLLLQSGQIVAMIGAVGIGVRIALQSLAAPATPAPGQQVQFQSGQQQPGQFQSGQHQPGQFQPGQQPPYGQTPQG